MADFKSRMAAMNKKKSVLDDLAAVESNRVDLEDDFNIEKRVNNEIEEKSTDKSEKNITEIPQEKNEVKADDLFKTSNDSSKEIVSDQSAKGITKDQINDKNKALTEKVTKEAKKQEDKKTPSISTNETKTRPVKETDSDNIIIDKSSLSLGRTSINYIKINAKLQRVSQTEFFVRIIEELKQTKNIRKSYDYDNFETERRVVVNRSSINIFLPHDDMEWLKDYAAVNCMSVSHIIENYIQNKIKEEQA